MIKNRTYNILVVDDEIDICQILQYNLEKEGYSVAVATSAKKPYKKTFQISTFCYSM